MSKKVTTVEATEPVVEIVEGGRKVTLHGVTVTVPDEALDDFEVLDGLQELGKGRPQALPGLLRRLIGDESSKALDAIRGDNGRVSILGAHRFVMDLLGAINPN